VVNPAGEVEPLVTEQAAELVAQADPVWCPNTAPGPTPGANGCSPAFDYGSYAQPLIELIAWLAANDPNAAGTIWIEDSYDSAAEGVAGFTLDGGSFANLDNSALRIQGGWDGVSGSQAITGSSTFTGDYLHITDWNAAVTLNDIVVDGAASTGIMVTTDGDIFADDIRSSNNTGAGSNGAYLDNYRGDSNNTGNITLTGTNVFNDNAGHGLDAQSNQQISTNNLTANDNADRGANLYNRESGYTMTISGTNVFNNNGTWGLAATNRSSILAENITAQDNTGSGAAFETFDLTDNTITLTGTNVFSGNGDYGLRTLSHVQVYLENVTADENGEDGAFILDLGSLDVTMAGTNSFSDIDARGLRIVNRGGAVTLNNITASDNALQGVVLVAGGTLNSNITSLDVTGTNVFNGNGGNGLEAQGATLNGAVNLNNVTASGNGGSGVVLNNTPSTAEATISLTGTNTFSGNISYGLYAVSDGFISAANLTAEDNAAGVELANSTSASNAGISLTGTNVLAGNVAGGLTMLSNGDVELYGVSTNDNTSGASIDTAADVTITCSSFANETTGLSADSASLSLTGVTFSGNGTDISSTSTPTINPFVCDQPNEQTVIYPSKPINEVQTDGGSVDLDCELYRGTQLILPNGDFAYFPCPLQDSASLSMLNGADLPGALPVGTVYRSGFTTALTENGQATAALNESITVAFALPPDADTDSLLILFWDGSQWTELDGLVGEDGAYLQAAVRSTGSFLLVSR
jgi:hypothetical protein